MSCRPSSGDHTRPSPRLPPSPYTKHRNGAREKDGALVTPEAVTAIRVRIKRFAAIREQAERQARAQMSCASFLLRLRADLPRYRYGTRRRLAREARTAETAAHRADERATRAERARAYWTNRLTDAN